MAIVIRIIGVAFLLIGIVFAARPEILKAIVAFLGKGSRIYLAAAIRLALAVVFLIGARECRYFPAILALGILFLIGGMLILLLGPRRLRFFLDWFARREPLVARLLAAVVLIVAIIVIVSA